LRILLTIIFLISCTYCISINRPVKADVTIPISLKASEFVKLNARDYSRLTGKKMSLLDRISFEVLKMRIKKDLKKNPDLLITDYADTKKEKFKLNGLWFALGLFLGPFAVIAAYLSIQKKNKVNSAWIGFGVQMIIYIILLIVFIAALSSSLNSCEYAK
jgi:hypothetical protein